MEGTKVKKAVGFGLLMLVLGLATLSGIGVHQSNGKSGVPTAHAGFGPPPDLTGGGNAEPTSTPTPRP